MMQAVMLVAGKSTRTYPLTLTRPKPLLAIGNKTIIEYNLENLEGLVDEVVLIVGYRQEMIKERLGNQWRSIKISYCEQKEQLGTGHAILQTEPFIKDCFIALNGDDIYAHDDMKKLVKFKYAALVRYEEDPSQYGVYQVDDRNQVLNLVEKPKQFIGNLTNVGCYIFDKAFFEYIKTTPLSERGEIEITSSILDCARKEPFFVEPLTGFWLANGYPWELLNSQEFFMKRETESSILGQVEANVSLKGPVRIGPNTAVKSGAYIEGPVVIGANCRIGPNCYIRGCTSIGDNCVIGHSVEIKNSIIFNNTNICHLSYVGDSVIGEGVNLGAGFISANVRHDGANVRSGVKGALVDTRLRKFGTAIGDGVRTGINTSVYPGRKIWPDMTTSIGQIVKYDLTN